MTKAWRCGMSTLLLVMMLTAALPAKAAGRVALIIANGAYSHVPHLPNPPADAALVGTSLRRAGFAVDTVRDTDKPALEAALQRFGARAEGAEAAVIYYAGHGIEVAGTNYVVPVGARLLRDRDVAFEAVALDAMLAATEGARLRLVMLDACRENPFAVTMARTGGGRSVGRGLVRPEPDGDTLVMYAARAGAIAADGAGANSPFATALARRLVEPGVEIRFMVARVRDDVLAATGRQQEPFSYGSLSSREFYFVAARDATAAVTAASVASPPPAPSKPIDWGITTADLSYAPAATLLAKARYTERQAAVATAAGRGDNTAALLLSFARFDGVGQASDRVESTRLLKAAAAQGQPRAMYELSMAYRFGFGIAPDQQESERWARRSADLGNAMAMRSLGDRLLGDAPITEERRLEGIEWYHRAVTAGDPMARHNLTVKYATGLHGLDPGAPRALDLFRRGAATGDRLAMLSLGTAYERGRGVPVARDQAAEWYRKAAAAGSDEARAALTRLRL